MADLPENASELKEKSVVLVQREDSSSAHVAETINIASGGMCLFAFPDSSAYLFQAIPCPNCTCDDCLAYKAKTALTGKEADDDNTSG